MTIIIQIGNTDNKLTQQEWSRYCRKVDECVRHHADEIHFYGHPPGDQPWQNAAWITQMDSLGRVGLVRELGNIKREFNQDSIAITLGETEFC